MAARGATDDAVIERHTARFDEARIDAVLARIPEAPAMPGDGIEPGPGESDAEGPA